MLEAADVAQSAQLAGVLSSDAVGAVGNQAMLSALHSDHESEGHAAQVASILERAEIPSFEGSSPLNVWEPPAALEAVHVPQFTFSGTEPVAYAQVEQTAVDMMR